MPSSTSRTPSVVFGECDGTRTHIPGFKRPLSTVGTHTHCIGEPSIVSMTAIALSFLTQTAGFSKLTVLSIPLIIGGIDLIRTGVGVGLQATV